MSEANTYIIINELLKEAGWILPGDDGIVNVDVEARTREGYVDYVLKDKLDYPLCVIEAKNENVEPLEAKEQAMTYAESLNCLFVILSNGVKHYLWDIKQGSPNLINRFPSQEELESRKSQREAEQIDVG